MILLNTDFGSFSERIKTTDKKIILFGAGTLLQTWIPYIIEKHELLDRILYIVDSDPCKNGTEIEICNKKFNIQYFEQLNITYFTNVTILITSSYFSGIVNKMDSLDYLRQTECYVAPIMHISYVNKKQETLSGYNRKAIPKVIHYCWFGNKEKPEFIKKCIASWKQYCPDYEIVEWNENNYNVKKNKYMEQAYSMGKYGYVPDYARIDILHEFGGIYLDTDVEIIKSFDDLLPLGAFTSFEEYPMINFGSGSGTINGLDILQEILDFRRQYEFVNFDGSINKLSCGFFETIPFRKHGIVLDGNTQRVADMTILSSDYFNVKSSITGRINITNNTHSIHHFNWSWVDEKRLAEIKTTHELYEIMQKRMVANE
jgi:hypothetical protein